MKLRNFSSICGLISTNSLIVVGPILYGLLVRNEWKRLSNMQYLGLASIVIGITLIALFRRQ